MTITLSSPPLVPATRWNYGASVNYTTSGIGRDMKVALQPGNDDSVVAVFLASAPVTAGSLAPYNANPPNSIIVGVMHSLQPSVTIPACPTTLYPHILLGRYDGSTAATVVVTGELPSMTVASGGTATKLVKFTGSTSIGDSIATDNTTSITVAGGLGASGNLTMWTGQTGGWRDLIMPLLPPNSGPTIPVMTQVAASAISLPLWQINDAMWVYWHIQHDYAPGTQIYMHMHWLADGTNANTVRWEFTFYHAKGHDQASFALGGAGTTVTATQASSAQYRHMITETTGVSISGLEPDSVILTRVRRITNGGVNNTDGIFGFIADLHYQADSIATKNRTPNFYT